MTKTVTRTDDDTYKVTLEQYVTGTVTQGKVTPVDIVLVLDTSSSMSDEKNNITSSGGRSITRLAALKNAVKSFIGQMAESSPDSRIGIVSFNGSAKIEKDLVKVSDNSTTLKNTVTALTTSRGTNSDAGLETAEQAFKNIKKADDESGKTGNRRVVIMFTDGVPATGKQNEPGFSTAIANGAISAAKTLKGSSYSATVYTIGVFSSGDKTGSVDTYMNYVSSNYPSAESMTKGNDKAADTYYMHVSSEQALIDAFKTIGQAEGKPDVTLDSSAVLTDVVASNFKAPENTTDVKVYTAAYDGTDFGERTEYTGATVNIDQNGAVTVSGFDYSANYVSKTAHPNDADNYGKKLIVEFTITVDREKTYGGTQPSNSGAYIKLGEDKYADVEDPSIPVDITNGFTCSYTDKKTYDETGFDVKAAFEKMLQSDGLTTANNKNQYVNIAYEVKSGDAVVGTYTVKAGTGTGTWNSDDSVMTNSAVGTYTYTVTCKVTDDEGTAGYKSGVTNGKGTMTLKIKPATDLAVTATDYKGVYDGQEHGGTVTATDGATIKYSTDGGATWVDTAPTRTDVGTTTVKVKAIKDNYADVTSEYTIEITKRPVTITASDVTRKYTGDQITVDNISDTDVVIVPAAETDLVKGHSVDLGETAIYSASGIEPGVYNGAFYTDAGDKITITDAEGKNVTDNYEITLTAGKLTIYKAAVATIAAKKLLDGKTPAAEQFSFKLEGLNQGDTTKSVEKNNVNGYAVFNIPYESRGTYRYKLSEVIPADAGNIDYDTAQYYVKVEVSYNSNTKTYSSEVSYYTDEDCTNKIVGEIPVFNNKTKTGTLTVKKTVSGIASATKDYEFKLTVPTGTTIDPNSATAVDPNVNTGNLVYQDNNFKLKAGDTKTFTLPAGTKYTVTETTTGYTVTAEVDGKAYALKDNSVSGEIAAGATTDVVFDNYQRRPYIPPTPDPAKKITVTITGNTGSEVYDATEHNVKGYTWECTDPSYTEADFEFTGTAEAKGTYVGKYDMGIKAEQFKNLNSKYEVEFVVKTDGELDITKRPLTITAGSAEGYGPEAITCDTYKADEPAAGDKLVSVKITGKQSVPGSSANVPSDAVIQDASGKDVTANYDIKYVNGTLTMLDILNKEDHFNYVIGYPDGTVRPSAEITRAEVATIFFRLLTDDSRKEFDTKTSAFTDVDDGQWYTRAIATLAKAKIVSGDPEGTFRPNDAITRAEMATIIARFADLSADGKTFSDISGHWAQKYIELAAGNGWINGYTDGTFRPDKKITRAETFSMINRVLGRQTDSNDDLLPVSQMTNWSDNADTSVWYYRDMQEATNNHKCERLESSGYEKWTEKLPEIDWASYQI